jgi:hypothetical protein
MEYSHRYCAYPNDGVAAALHRHIDIHRQAYNHTRWEYTTLPEDTDTIGSAYKHHDRLTDWKDDYPLFSEVHSKALQRTVTRFYNNLSILKEKRRDTLSGGLTGSRRESTRVSRIVSLASNSKTRVARLRHCGSPKSVTFHSATIDHSPTKRQSKKSRSNTKLPASGSSRSRLT